MGLSDLFLWFYGLRLSQASVVMLCGMWMLMYLHQHLVQKRWWRITLAVSLCLAVLAILAQTILLRTPAEHGEGILAPFASYRALQAGGNPEILRSNLMNVLLFCPLGLLGCMLGGDRIRFRQVLLVTLLLGLLSCGIEWIQLATARGLCETDDVIHNTLGAFCGSVFGWLYSRLAG